MLRVTVLAAAMLMLAMPAGARPDDPPPGPPPTGPVPPALSANMPDTAIAQTLDGWFANLSHDGQFDGVALVAHNGREVFSGGYGLAERGHNRAWTVETRFALASIGKLFTAIAVARLEQQGRLRGTDTIARLIPDYPNAASRTATVDQLLNMRGGVADTGSTEDASAASLASSAAP